MKSYETKSGRILNVIGLITFTMLLSTITGSAGAQSGFARAMCSSHIPMVTMAIDYRRQGIPIDMARDLVDDSYDTNVDLWRWLKSAVADAYQKPDRMESAIRNGDALENCIKNVRGY